MKRRWLLGAAFVALGCGGAEQKAPLPAMTNVGGGPVPSEGAAVNKDGTQATKGENPLGPKRTEADKKIAEIRASQAYSEDLKKQLIEEVERTYQEAQKGIGKQ